MPLKRFGSDCNLLSTPADHNSVSQIRGLILINTCLDSLSPGLNERGCTDQSDVLLPIITHVTATPNEKFAFPEAMVTKAAPTLLGNSAKQEVIDLWNNSAKAVYAGDLGRLKLRQATIASVTRDSLHLRASDLTLPILWIQGSEDAVFSVENAKYELGLTKSSDAHLEVIEGAPHAAFWTHAAEIDKLVLIFLAKHGGKINARALREAVGTVDI
jgi:pimeloyl-ACP methyl ester carboxylesterase